MLKKLRRIPVFFKEVREELTKVNWSTPHELFVAVVVVVIVSALLTIYIFFVDLGLSQAVKFILR